jgi:hypothetical protein
MIEGLARPDATEKWAASFPRLQFKQLGRTGLTVSPIGFGCYRIALGNAEHERALSSAISAGVNLIDTSANYGDGLSEQLVGKVLRDLIARDQIQREQIVLVTKAGYIQGSNLEIVKRRARERTPFPEVVEIEERLQHCIHPEFLEDQLTRGSERLGCGGVDGFLLHNPEYFLEWAQSADWDLDDARAEYYRRIEAAFVYLEEQAEAGRIRFYGVSSNTFPSEPDDFSFTSLSELLRIAERLGCKHFALIQFPMNLMETGGVTVANQGVSAGAPGAGVDAEMGANEDAETGAEAESEAEELEGAGGADLMTLCRERGMGVLINRPLNAFYGGRMLRLAETKTFMDEDDPNFSLVDFQMQFLKGHIAVADEEWGAAGDLSQIAIRALRSTEGVDSVLVGMRTPHYVRNAVEEWRKPVRIAPREESWINLELT